MVFQSQMIRTFCFLSLLLNVNALLAADSSHVAVASNMSHVISEILDQYKPATRINLSFGSSGNFARQILQGAPYKLFISADKKYVDMLVENGYGIDSSAEFARGRIGIFIPNDSALNNHTSLGQVFKSLYHGRYQRISIANPEHAPFGRAAEQALQNAGLWIIQQGKLLIGENAAQALQFALSGGVDLSIIPSSFARLPGIINKGKFYLIPKSWHEPIQQVIVLFNGANESTRQFYHYLLSDEAKIIIRKYGYETETGSQQ